MMPERRPLWAQVEDKLSRARLLDEQAYHARQASGTPTNGGGGWWGGAVSRLSNGLKGGGGGGDDLRESAATLQVMEATLSGDVAEMVAEREREMVRPPRATTLQAPAATSAWPPAVAARTMATPPLCAWARPAGLNLACL